MMKHTVFGSTRVILCLVLLASALGGSLWAEDSRTPLALHPDNPHYFLWRGKPTVLVTSAEHYGAVLNLDFDYETYLRELERHGLNLTRVFNGVYRELPGVFKIEDNTLAPDPGKFLSPWARSNQPGESDGGNKFDLSRWDEAYFARLKAFMQAAQKRGVVVEYVLFNPMYRQELWDACPMNARNNVNGFADCGWNDVYRLENTQLTQIHLALTRKIVEELNAFDNLYFEICNEPYVTNQVQTAWQHRMIDEIVRVESALPRRHLISLNISNGRTLVENPHPAVSIFNFHYSVPPDTVSLNYHLNKVIGENETGFRGTGDVPYRTEGWDFLLAGGGLYNNLDYSFSVKHPDGSFRGFDSPGGGSVELRQQLSILKRFVEALPFLRMRPDASVVKQTSQPLSVQALVEPGQVYAIYLHVPLPEQSKDLSKLLRDDVQTSVKLDLPPGRYVAEWVDTKTGAVAARAELNVSESPAELQSPQFANDIALRVVRQ